MEGVNDSRIPGEATASAKGKQRPAIALGRAPSERESPVGSSSVSIQAFSQGTFQQVIDLVVAREASGTKAASETMMAPLIQGFLADFTAARGTERNRQMQDDSQLEGEIIQASA